MRANFSTESVIACCVTLYALEWTTLSRNARTLYPLSLAPWLPYFIDPTTYPMCVAFGYGLEAFYAHWTAALILVPALRAGEDTARLLWSSRYVGRSPERKARYWARQRVWLRWFLDGLFFFGTYQYIRLVLAAPAAVTPITVCWMLAAFRATALVTVLLPETELPK